MRPVQSLAAVVVLVLAVAVASSKSGLNPSADLLLLDAARDPLGEADSFARLSHDDQETLWSYNEEATLAERAKAAQAPLEVGVPVDVRLVGFDGDSNYRAALREADLLKYLEAAAGDVEASVLEPQEGAGHALPLRYKVAFHVSKAGRGVAAALAALVRDAAKEGRRAVRASAVQDIVARDYREAALTGYAVYLLNVPSPSEPRPEGDETSSDPPHYYLHDAEAEAAPGARSLTRCPATVGVSPDWRARLVWLDLSVPAPVSGPHSAGDGFVSRFSLPHVGRFLERPRQAAGPAAPRLAAPALMAEAAAFVQRAVRHLFAPPAAHAPALHPRRLRVRLTVVRDGPAAPSSSAAPRPDFGAIEALLAPLRLAGQELVFERVETDFAECPACAAAFHLARRSHTSTVLQGGLKVHVHEYVDAAVLAARLAEAFGPGARGGAGAGGAWRGGPQHGHAHGHGHGHGAEEHDFAERDDERVVRAFVYDLQTTDLLLLDRFHQAAAAGGVAVALQTRSGLASVDFVCGEERAVFDPSDATRPLLAAILQAGWAVAPTHQHWSPLRNETVDDWAFSACTGHTPFGGLCALRPAPPALSFAALDAAARHAVLGELLYAGEALRHIAEHLASFRAGEGEVLRGEAHAAFVRRWNVLFHKLHRAAAALALFNFNTTLYYARSARHDLRALHGLVKTASAGLHPYLHCYGDDGDGGGRAQIALAILIVLAVCVATAAAIVVSARRQREEAAARPKAHAH